MTKEQFYLHTLADHWQEMGYPYAADLLRHHANEGVPAFREIVGGSPQVSERAPQGGGPVIFGTPDLGGGHNQAKLTFYHVHPDGQQQRLGSVGFTRPEGHAVMRTLQAAGHKGAEIDAARTLPEGWKAPKAHQSFLPTLNTARPEAPEQDWRPNEVLPEDFYGYSRKRLARAKARHDGRKAARKLARQIARLAREAGLRPGEPTEDGGNFEPEREPPDLGEFIANKFKGDYGDPEPGIGYSTGFLLSDGRGVPMGPGERYEDHRAAIPTTTAMRRWGWPEEIARGAEQGTRTPALFELMRRAGAVRVHASRGDLVLHLASPLTGRQAAAIRSHVESHRPHSVVVEVQGGGDAQLDRPDPEDVMHAIARAMRPRPRRNGRPYRAPAGGTVVRGVFYVGGSLLPDLTGDFATGQAPTKPTIRRVASASAIAKWLAAARRRSAGQRPPASGQR